MKNRWKTISIISWIVLAIILALGIFFMVSEKRENATLKAEVEKYKSIALVDGDGQEDAAQSDSDKKDGSSGDSKDSSTSGKDAKNNGANNNGGNGQNAVPGQNVVYVEKEVPKYIYVAAEPDKTEPAPVEPSTDDDTPAPETDDSNAGNLAFAEGVTYQM